MFRKSFLVFSGIVFFGCGFALKAGDSYDIQNMGCYNFIACSQPRNGASQTNNEESGQKDKDLGEQIEDHLDHAYRINNTSQEQLKLARAKSQFLLNEVNRTMLDGDLRRYYVGGLEFQLTGNPPPLIATDYSAPVEVLTLPSLSFYRPFGSGRSADIATNP